MVFLFNETCHIFNNSIFAIRFLPNRVVKVRAISGRPKESVVRAELQYLTDVLADMVGRSCCNGYDGNRWEMSFQNTKLGIVRSKIVSPKQRIENKLYRQKKASEKRNLPLAGTMGFIYDKTAEPILIVQLLELVPQFIGFIHLFRCDEYETNPLIGVPYLCPTTCMLSIASRYVGSK